MRFGTLIKILSALVLVVLVAVALFLKSMDFNEYKELLAHQVKASTGRDLVIQGDFDLKLSLSPALAVNGLTFANAPWGSRPEMVKLERLEVVVDLLPLLSGDIQVQRLMLISPHILLETDPQGRGNWIFDKEGKSAAPSDLSASSTGGLPMPVVNAVQIVDASLTYRDGPSQKINNFSIEELTGRAASLESPMELEVVGAYNTNRIQTKAKTGSLSQLINPAAPFPLHLEIRMNENILTSDGTLQTPLEGKGIDLKLSASGRDLAELLKLADLPQMKGTEINALGPFEVAADISGSKENLALKNLKISLGNQETLLVNITGEIKKVLEGKGVDLQFIAESPNLAKFPKLTKTDLPSIGPFHLMGRVTDPDGVYAIKELNLKLGRSALAGSLSLKADGARPFLKADITSLHLEPDEFLSQEEKWEGMGAQGTSGTKGSNKDRVFSDDPFPLDGLRLADARMSLAQGRLVSSGVELGNITLDMALENGRLSIPKLAAEISTGGTLSGSLSLDGQKPQAALKASLQIKNIDLPPLLKKMEATNLLSEGKADLEMNLAGSGESLRILMAGLDGKVSLLIGKGRIENKYMDFMAADLMNLIIPGGAKKEYTALNCFVCRFDIKDGLASDKGLLLDTEQMTVAGEGSINLAEESLKLTMNPSPKEKALVSLAVPVHIRGTFLEPSVQPDAAAVVKGVAGAVLGTALMGPIGLLVPLSKGGTEEKNPCLEALGGKVKGTTASGPTTENVPAPTPSEKPTEKVKGILKGLGGLFNN